MPVDYATQSLCITIIIILLLIMMQCTVFACNVYGYARSFVCMYMTASGLNASCRCILFLTPSLENLGFIFCRILSYCVVCYVFNLFPLCVSRTQ